jgi:hypothetical protein
MTNEEINKAVAEKVMHAHYPEWVPLQGQWNFHKGKEFPYYEEYYDVFNPAERIDHAWMVMEKFDDIVIVKDKKWICSINIADSEVILKDYQSPRCYTAQMAICLAALEAVPPARVE